MKSKNAACRFLFLITFAVATSACQSAAQKLGWEDFSSIDGKFSVAMPGIPLEEVKDGYHTFTSSEGYFIYRVTYVDYPSHIPENLINPTLNKLQNDIISNGGTLVVVKDITLGNFIGREFRARESNDAIPRIIEARTYLVFNRVYRVSVRYLLPEGLSEKIGIFLDSFILLSDADLERLRSITPTGLHPDFDMSFVKIYYCNGNSGSPYVALQLINTGNVTFRKTINLVTADNHNALYGQGVDMGYSSSGFHTSSDICGAGDKEYLRPGETAYLSLGLYTKDCIPSCNAHAIIEICNDLSGKNTCAKQTVDFTVTQAGTGAQD